ncbi:hypothetical protein BDV19DRAFT_390502 [Aspergillus venezuelensis]
MVKVVVAGGTGAVSQEIVAEILNSGKHDVTIWTRSYIFPGVTYTQAKYDDHASMASLLSGVHSVVCFISQPEVQIALTDACIEAGVKRYAPNEWAAKSNSDAFAYHEKDQVHEYLQKVNKDKKAPPSNPQNSAPSGHNSLMLRIVAEALAFEGEWPEIGGITGTKTSSRGIIEAAERVRVADTDTCPEAGPFQIENVPTEILESGKHNTLWTSLLPEFPTADPKYDCVKFSEYVVAEITLGGLKGAWETSDEWNRLLPDLKLTTVEEFWRNIGVGRGIDSLIRAHPLFHSILSIHLLNLYQTLHGNPNSALYAAANDGSSFTVNHLLNSGVNVGQKSLYWTVTSP